MSALQHADSDSSRHTIFSYKITAMASATSHSGNNPGETALPPGPASSPAVSPSLRQQHASAPGLATSCPPTPIRPASPSKLNSLHPTTSASTHSWLRSKASWITSISKGTIGLLRLILTIATLAPTFRALFLNEGSLQIAK